MESSVAAGQTLSHRHRLSQHLTIGSLEVVYIGCCSGSVSTSPYHTSSFNYSIFTCIPPYEPSTRLMSAAQYYKGHDEPFDHTAVQHAHSRSDSQADLLPGEKTNLLSHEGQADPSFPVAQYDPTNVEPNERGYGHNLDPSEDTLNDPHGNDVEKAKYQDFGECHYGFGDSM